MQCAHCHVDASPYRKEVMSKSVLEDCLRAVDTLSLQTVDLTGGAPEMHPHFEWFIDAVAQRQVEVIVRSNLTVLVEGRFRRHPELFQRYGLTVVSSLPCYTASNTDQQRGKGAFERSIKALKRLNALGYGREKRYPLHLVYNPGGAAIAPDQKALEADYKQELKAAFDIDFHRLYTITNLPIARYLNWLLTNDQYDDYMQLLVNSFNAEAAKGVMCRNTISVDWQGRVYDCDFNQMLRLPVAVSSSKNIADIDWEEMANRTIAFNNHCFGCTAGSGSSCQGAIL